MAESRSKVFGEASGNTPAQGEEVLGGTYVPGAVQESQSVQYAEGAVRAHPTMGHREVFRTEPGARSGSWAAEDEPARNDLEGGGILYNGWRHNESALSPAQIAEARQQSAEKSAAFNTPEAKDARRRNAGTAETIDLDAIRARVAAVNAKPEKAPKEPGTGGTRAAGPRRDPGVRTVAVSYKDALKERHPLPGQNGQEKATNAIRADLNAHHQVMLDHINDLDSKIDESHPAYEPLLKAKLLVHAAGAAIKDSDAAFAVRPTALQDLGNIAIQSGTKGLLHAHDILSNEEMFPTPPPVAREALEHNEAHASVELPVPRTKGKRASTVTVAGLTFATDDEHLNSRISEIDKAMKSNDPAERLRFKNIHPQAWQKLKDAVQGRGTKLGAQWDASKDGPAGPHSVVEAGSILDTQVGDGVPTAGSAGTIQNIARPNAKEEGPIKRVKLVVDHEGYFRRPQATTRFQLNGVDVHYTHVASLVDGLGVKLRTAYDNDGNIAGGDLVYNDENGNPKKVAQPMMLSIGTPKPKSEPTIIPEKEYDPETEYRDGSKKPTFDRFARGDELVDAEMKKIQDVARKKAKANIEAALARGENPWEVELNKAAKGEKK